MKKTRLTLAALLLLCCLLLCACGGKLPRNRIRAPGGRKGSKGCRSVFIPQRYGFGLVFIEIIAIFERTNCTTYVYTY